MYRFQSGIIINGPLEVAGDQGSAGEVLTSGGAGAPPTWGAGGGATGSLDVNLLASAITTLTAGNPIVFDSVIQDPGSDYNAGTGVFTIAQTGLYLLTLSVLMFNNSAGIFPHQTQIRVNGVSVTSQSAAFTPGTYCDSCSIVIYLTASDTVHACLNETIGSGIGTAVAILNDPSTRMGISAL